MSDNALKEKTAAIVVGAGAVRFQWAYKIEATGPDSDLLFALLDNSNYQDYGLLQCVQTHPVLTSKYGGKAANMISLLKACNE